jgi:hypothetical protein
MYSFGFILYYTGLPMTAEVKVFLESIETKGPSAWDSFKSTLSTVPVAGSIVPLHPVIVPVVLN